MRSSGRVPRRSEALLGQACALCGAAEACGRLELAHVHTSGRTGRRTRVGLRIRLCEGCGDRIEKHVRRAVPGRLIETEDVD